MIGQEGSYLFDCEIEGNKNFIEFEDEFFFRVSEFAGGILPEFEMEFITRNNNIMKLMHEGTLIKGKFGRDINSLSDMTLFCTSSTGVDNGNGYTRFIIVGFCINIDYVRSPILATFKNMSAIEAVLAVAAKNFKKIETNITKSNDSQNWYQPNITNKNFISKTLYRADLGAAFPAMAITLEGKFILKDVVKDLAKKPKWKFVSTVQNQKDPNEISYITDAPQSSNSGIINAMIGYGFDFKSMVAETEEKVTAVIQSRNVMANTGKVGGSKTSNRKQVIGITQNENHHDNYQKSYNYNLFSLMNLSRNEIPFTIDAAYYAIRPLDTATFFGGVDANTGAADENTAGAYFVTQVVRQIENRHMHTTVKISRESVNGVR